MGILEYGDPTGEAWTRNDRSMLAPRRPQIRVNDVHFTKPTPYVNWFHTQFRAIYLALTEVAALTIIAVRDGIMACDSRMTHDSEAGGSRFFRCHKMYRKKDINGNEVIIGLAGETSPALIFLDWYGTKKKPPAKLIDGDADFWAVVMTKDGLMFYDAWCRGEKVDEPFFAIGSGAKAALGAMHMGASAAEAAEITCRIDPYCAPPVITMQLGDISASPEAK